MTCKEKLQMEHPECYDVEKYGASGCRGCPSDYDYVEDLDQCCIMDCADCWDQEIPEKVIESVDICGSIKDSGDRTQFETGAVRDMREGKGRCDLMPLEVVANLISRRRIETDDTDGIVIHNIRTFVEKNDTYYLYFALEDFCGQCYSHSIPTMLLEVAKHFEEGAKKYGENNWQKGIPVNCYIDSAVRHYLKWLRGDTDEPHDRAFVWNLMCCIWEVDYRKTTVEEG